MTTNNLSRRSFLQASSIGAAATFAGLTSWTTAAVAASPKAKLTMLNDTAGRDFDLAVRRHVALDLQWLDLKDAIWDQNINNLSLDNAHRAAKAARANNLGVFCLSTGLCVSNIETGERAFREQHEPVLDHVLKVAEVLKPQSIRLLSAMVQPFPEKEPVIDYLKRRRSWVFDVYREMVDRIVESGHRCLIENEIDDTIFNRVASIQGFFDELRRPGRAYFTWDIQNLWQCGVFPTLDVYRQLKPLIGCVHLKGGRSEDGKTLAWASSLEEASWPVADIMRAVVADGVSPVICLNPSHGKPPPDFDPWEVVQRDVAFLRKEVSADL